MKKETKKNEMAVDRTLDTDLFSQDFILAIKRAYEIETRKKHVENVVRAYNVFLDLQGGIALERIEKYRLERFHTFLWAYISLNPTDKISVRLWEKCDQVLSEISA